MLLVIVNTILDSISDIIYKKTLAISDIKPTVFQFLWELCSIPVILGIMIWKFDFSLFSDPIIFGGFIFIVVCFILENNLGQYLYKHEKLSTLLPYTKINNFIVIIVGFLFFRDSSLLSFLICMGAIVLATLESIDFKNHSFPDDFWPILLHEAIKTVGLMASVYILEKVSSIDYAVMNQVVYIIGAFLVILFTRELSEFKKLTPKVIQYRFVGYTIWLASWFIDIFLLKEFWVVIITLFGFFGSSLSLVLAFFFLREVPEKKEIALGVVMIILAWVGYYFR